MRWGNRNRISPPTSNNQNKHNIRNNGLQNTRHQEREESDPWGRNKRGEPYSCSSSPLERVLRRWCRERGTQAGHPELKSRAENLGRPRELVCKTEVPEERTSQRKSQRPAEDRSAIMQTGGLRGFLRPANHSTPAWVQALSPRAWAQRPEDDQIGINYRHPPNYISHSREGQIPVIVLQHLLCQVLL